MVMPPDLPGKVRHAFAGVQRDALLSLVADLELMKAKVFCAPPEAVEHKSEAKGKKHAEEVGDDG